MRAVAACPIPLICGVGHETDVTLSDMAADLRAATPTAAAELAAPARDELVTARRTLALRLQRGVQRALDRQAQRLDLLAHRAGRPAARLSGEHERLAGLQRRMVAAAARRLATPAEALPRLARRMSGATQHVLQRRRDVLEALGARLRAAHPQHVLARGFAWVTDANGQPVMRAGSLQPGQSVQAVFADGRAQAEIVSVQTGAAAQGQPGGKDASA